MDSMYLRLSKSTLFLHLADPCLDLGIGENQYPAGKFGSILGQVNIYRVSIH